MSIRTWLDEYTYASGVSEIAIHLDGLAADALSYHHVQILWHVDRGEADVQIGNIQTPPITHPVIDPDMSPSNVYVNCQHLRRTIIVT